MGVSAYEFAGNERVVRSMMRWYAAMFERGPILDVGSGRGHFLEAARDRDLEVSGVDIAEEAIVAARSLGFEVAHADALDHLRSRRDLGGIFAAHVVEHLTPDYVAELFRAAAEALAPGGQLLVVTPNFRDWRVAGEIFWLDPTHVRPYPAALLAAYASAAGLRPEARGAGPSQHGLRAWPSMMLGKIRHGLDYGRSEDWILARRP